MMALDRAPAAVTFDCDGRLRVFAPISKATVSPYKGKELPAWDQLLLDPTATYRLFRDPSELQRAASTFNGVPLLRRHMPSNAANPQKDDIVGAVGTDCEFDNPFLRASLIVWSKDGIDLISSGEQRQLSAAYHFTVDMQPGNFGNVPFDGVMRNLVGNHVSLVKVGRAGKDVAIPLERNLSSPNYAGNPRLIGSMGAES